MNLILIQNKIYDIREQKVMLDFDLAELYKVETRVLKQAIRRNKDRFPDDFMFVLSNEEWKFIRSQTVMLQNNSYSKYNPFAFTEHGVTMLASVLRSESAIKTNIAIVRAFIMMRHMAINYKGLADKITTLELKYDKQFKDIFEALQYLMAEKDAKDDWDERQIIGFKK